MNDTLCILPFISLDRNTDSTNIPPATCCLYQAQSKTAETFEQYWHSDEIVSVRSQMLQGEQPKGCWKCFHEESLGKTSMRQSVNSGRLDAHKTSLTTHPDHPVQVKMLAGATCNLACRMCVGHVSSKVNTVWQAIGRPSQDPYKYDQQADQYIRNNAQHIAYIDLMGGEPLYHKKLIALLKFLVDSNNANHITLYLTTNGMLIKDEIKNLLLKFKKVVSIFSLDGVGVVHEYIRPGSEWQTIIDNMSTLRLFENIDVLVQPTISVLNILRLPELDQWCKDNNYHMTQKCLVHDPIELHPKQLPIELREKVHSNYKKFLETKTYPALGFIKQLDEHWGTNIKTAMPEWDFETADQLENDLVTYEKVQKFLNNE